NLESFPETDRALGVAGVVRNPGVLKSLAALRAFVANATVQPIDRMNAREGQVKRQPLAPRHHVGLVQLGERSDQPGRSGSARSRTASSPSKNSGAASANGFDPSDPSASFGMSRRRHQIAALTVNKRLRPGR